MFYPTNYIKNRPDLFNLVQEVDNDRPLFYLVTDNPLYNEQNILERFELGLPYIPEAFNFTYRANYNRVSLAQGETDFLQFVGNDAETISIQNILLDTRHEKASFNSLIQTLKTLMLGQRNPSYFYLAIQNRVLYPYVLEDMRVIERGWINGQPVKGFLSLFFTKSPIGLDTTFIQDPFIPLNEINPDTIDESNSQNLRDVQRKEFETFFV